MLQLPEDALRPELAPDEQLLWFGQPRQGITLRPTDALLIPFTLLWGGFAIFWEASVISSGAPAFFALWGIPFVLVGLYMIFGRFGVDAQQRANTVYGVTNERVVIVSGLLSRQTKSLNLGSLAEISLAERSNGIGTITFGSLPFWHWMYGGIAWPGMGNQMVPQFELISEARVVYDLIRKAQKDAKRVS